MVVMSGSTRAASTNTAFARTAGHPDLVEDPNGETPANSTDEDLLVLYVGGPIDEEAVDQLVRAGGQQVAARIPTGTGGELPSSTPTDIASS